MSGIPSDSVRILLVTDEQKFPLVCETDDPGNWKLPGGRIEENEEPDLAAGRELQEELGLDSKAVNLRLLQKIMNEDGIHGRWIYWGRLDAPERLAPNAEVAQIELFNEHTVPDCPNKGHILAAYDLFKQAHPTQTA